MKRVTAVLLVLLTALAVFAACSKNSVHTVTFDSSGGTQIKTQHIRDGESAKKPWDPHKEGFTFIEWQYNGAAFDFNTAITGDITLVASYSIDEGTDIVLLVLCYGDGRENEIIEIKRGEAAFAPPTPEREGYKFEGWFNGDTEFDFSTPINDDLNLTAKWKVTRAGPKISPRRTRPLRCIRRPRRNIQADGISTAIPIYLSMCRTLRAG